MTTIKKQELSQLIKDKKLNEEVLWACLRKLEDIISEQAYRAGKYKYTGDYQRELDCRNYYIDARNKIRLLTKQLTDKIVPRIIEDVKQIPKTEGLSEYNVNRIVEMVNTGKFQLV